MDESVKLTQILEEIRDLHREQLELYRQAVADHKSDAQRSLELSEGVIRQSRRNSALYRLILVVIGIMLGVLIATRFNS